MATAKSNGASFDKDGAVNNCAGDDGGVAPIVSEVGAELENLHLGGNPGCSSAVTHDDDFSLQKGTYRKLLSIKRQLMVNMKYLNDKLQNMKKSELTNFNEIESSYNEFQVRLSNITDCELVSELYEGTADFYEKCCLSYDNYKNRTSDSNSKAKYGFDVLDATDSVSQTTEQVSLTSSSARTHQIKLDCQRAELRAMYDLEKGKAKT